MSSPEPCRQSAEKPLDPMTTELVRQSLNSVANQMKRALVRTAFSPTIFDAYDFAVAIYDNRIRLLAQSPTIPVFMGTLGFCVAAAVESVGGAPNLTRGDVLMYNLPYQTGSHAQDMVIIEPVFHDAHGLIGYAVSKAHHVDIGAKNPYCTDTTDVYQEGVLFPGVKLYSAGSRVNDIYRIALANSRAPRAMQGDLHAQIVCARVGAERLIDVIARFGIETFERGVETMFRQGERAVRKWLNGVPTGRYVASGHLDDDGVAKEAIPFEVVIDIEDSTATIDLRSAPGARSGPVNCPRPCTVSACRVALLMLAGSDIEPNEGHFRAIDVLTRPGSIFEPGSPAPCFLYGWSATQLMEAIFLAFAENFEGAAPAESAADIVSVGIVTRDQATGELLDFGPALPVGHGGAINGDGSVLFIAALSNSRVPSIELAEARYPIRYHKWEFVEDSFGVGRHRGAPAWDHEWEVLQDASLISTIDRTKQPARGVHGGGDAMPNRFALHEPGRPQRVLGRVTGLPLKPGTVLKVRAGGGGGYGPANERPRESVLADVESGLLSEVHARTHFPHAYADPGRIA